MRIADETIAAVRDAADIVDVVGDYVRLKKRGSNFVGLCPFHSEKTPSFNVNPRLGIYKCFGCGEGGDVFAFLERVDGVSFPEAVRALAERVGITIAEENEEQTAEQTERESVLHALQFAARFFHARLSREADGAKARDYLARRGISPEMVKRFGIGYAPDRWDALIDAAEKAGIRVELLELAGLVLPRREGSGHYDRYRDRLIFPIFSHVGKVIGFGGRLLEDVEGQPKYINSPETVAYSKSRVLYGLYQGKMEIRSREEAILVEGYTDVVALHQAGVRHVVASSGTALTTEQIQLLSRYARRVLLLYDADAAGRRATVRGIELLLDAGLAPFVVALPAGEDPDTFVRDQGGEAFVEYLKASRMDFVGYLHGRARAAGALDAPDTRAAAQKAIMRIVGRIPDTLVRESYLQQAASVLDVPEVYLRRAMQEGARRTTRSAPVPVEPPPLPGGVPSAREPVAPVPPEQEPLPEEKTLLRLMFDGGASMVAHILSRTSLDEFTEGPARETATALVDQYEGGRIDAGPFLDGSLGVGVQRLVAEIMTDLEEPSGNWSVRKISVPRLNEDAGAAADGAMTLLKLDRLDALIARRRRDLQTLEQEGGEVRPLQEELVGLQQLRRRIEDREFLD